MMRSLLVVTLGLAACTDLPARSGRPGGLALGADDFGRATAFNTAVQTGAINQVVGLNSRFAAEVDPSVTFAFDSATLSPGARATVARQARWIRQFPEVRFRVYGHTDLVGPPDYNKSLGLRRARAVVDELTRNGISRARLEAVVSFGETQPLVVTQGRERANRRTVTEVSGFVGTDGQLLDGKYARLIYRQYVDSAAEASEGTERVGGTASAADTPSEGAATTE